MSARARQWLLGRQYNYDYMEHFQSTWRTGLFSRPAMAEQLRLLPPGVINATWTSPDHTLAMQHSLFPEDHWYRRLVKERLPILQYETMSPAINCYRMRSSATLAQLMAYDWWKNIHQKNLSEDDAFKKTLNNYQKELGELVEKVKPYVGDAAAELALKMPFTQSLLCRVHARKVEVAAAEYATNVESLTKLGNTLKYQGWPVNLAIIEDVVLDPTASQADHMLYWLREAAFFHPITQSFVKEVTIRISSEQSGTGKESIIKTKVYPLWCKGIEAYLTDSLRGAYKLYRIAARQKKGLSPLPNSNDLEYEKAETQELFNNADTDEIYDASTILLCRNRGYEPPFTSSLLESHRILRHLLVKESRHSHRKAVNQHLISKLLAAGRSRRKDDDNTKRSGMGAVARGDLPLEFHRLSQTSQGYLLDYYEFANTPYEKYLNTIPASSFRKQRGYTDYSDHKDWIEESAEIDGELEAGQIKKKKNNQRIILVLMIIRIVMIMRMKMMIKMIMIIIIINKEKNHHKSM